MSACMETWKQVVFHSEYGLETRREAFFVDQMDSHPDTKTGLFQCRVSRLLCILASSRPALRRLKITSQPASFPNDAALICVATCPSTTTSKVDSLPEMCLVLQGLRKAERRNRPLQQLTTKNSAGVFIHCQCFLQSIYGLSSL